MSKLQLLIDEANKSKSLQDKVYGGFPVEIAKDCGPEEVAEIIERLDKLSLEKAVTDAADGDSTDNIWRAQNGYSELLAKILPRFVDEVCAGLKSDQKDTGFFIVNALLKSPTNKAIPYIEEYLKNDLSDPHRKVAEDALKKCKSKRSLIHKLRRKNS